MQDTPSTGLILSGGGARAAYQVGVLQALVALRRTHPELGSGNPFDILCGTSAGAINATALACGADDFDGAVDQLAQVWHHFRAEQVYRADAIGVLRSGAQWLSMLSVGWMLARWAKARPRSMLNNAPLADLLARVVRLEQLPEMLAQGHLKALAISASSYSTGVHVTFFESNSGQGSHERMQRLAVPSKISLFHLLASSAIPFVFPAQYLNQGAQTGWYGDGSMRQTAPISPAIHLGAQRVLIIGVGRMNEPPNAAAVRTTGYPSLSQISGHALSSIFLDGLSTDIERMERINRTLLLMTAEQRQGTPLQPIQALVISPSERIDDIAMHHQDKLPRPIRAMLRGVGSSSAANDSRGAALASYLLFEAPFTRELMALGMADTLARRDEVLAFFSWRPTPSS